MPAHGHDVPGAYSFRSWEPLFLALGVARGGALRSGSSARARVWMLAPGRLHPRASSRRRLAQLATRDARGELPPARPPAPERDDRRLGAAAPPPRSDTRDESRLARRGGRPLALLTRPKVALPVWLVGWYAIHLAGFYDAALRNQWLLHLEHALLVALGLSSGGPSFPTAPPALDARLGSAICRRLRRLRVPRARAHLRSRPVYDLYEEAPRLWGLSAARDETFAGVLMTVEQALVFLVAIGYFVLRLIDEDEEEPWPS